MILINKDNILLSDDELFNNPYICINKMLRDGKNVSRGNTDFTEVQIEYFNNLFKELKCKVNDNNVIYLNDFELVYYFLDKNNGTYNLNLSWMSDEQKDKVCELLKNKVINGKIRCDHLPVDFIIENYEFLKQSFI